jgi:hypothetical protein
MIYAILGFIFGVCVIGAIWYIKDYCLDCLYLKGYSRGYEKAMNHKKEMVEFQKGFEAGLKGEPPRR